jgi:aminopeptidase N
MRRPLAVPAAITTTLLLAAAPAAWAAPEPRAGSTGGGDPYFPAAGNGGYEVEHYDLDLGYDPATRALTGTATLTANATEALSSFSLDLRGLAAESVDVDGAPAAIDQQDGELVVTPAAPLAAGAAFTVTVRYGGTTGQPTDPTGAVYGWVSTDDGAFVANEPDAASTWYPVNDVPTDKATYAIAVTVPEGRTAVANGELVSATTTDGRTTWSWSAADPIASYLTTASVGDYDLTTTRTAAGLPIIDAVDRDLDPTQRAVTTARLSLQPVMVEHFTALLGPYPFTSAGAIVDDDTVAGYALETQTRPIYAGVPTESTIAHEIAHQWLGNSVTPSTWRDIWLNEGFATWAEWSWDEASGGPSVQDRFDENHARPEDDPLWAVAPGDPGAEDLFAEAVYTRGAMALHALEARIGEEAFATLLRRWVSENAGQNVATADLVALAEDVSGQQLDDFFTRWVDTPGKPDDDGVATPRG